MLVFSDRVLCRNDCEITDTEGENGDRSRKTVQDEKWSEEGNIRHLSISPLVSSWQGGPESYFELVFSAAARQTAARIHYKGDQNELEREERLMIVN